MKFLAFGDSVMWGQGHRDEDKFVVRAAQQIAQRRGVTFNRSDLTILAHSGATIDATKEEIEEYLSDYPYRFPSSAAKDLFRKTGYIPEDKLSGEVPRTFPTVLAQINNYHIPPGQNIDVVFVTGGGNDLNFVKYLTKRDNRLVVDQVEILDILETRYRKLIQTTLEKFPNALIIATGYYPILSRISDHPLIKKMAYEFENKSGSIIGFNEWLHSPDIPFPGNELFWDAIRYVAFELADAINVGEYAFRAVQYNLNAYFMASQVMRRVVTQSNADNILYVEPGISPGKCLFTRDSHIFADYLDQNTSDAAKAERVAAGKAFFDAFEAHHGLNAKYKVFHQRLNEIQQLETQIDVLRKESNSATETTLQIDKLREKIRNLQAENNAYVATGNYRRFIFYRERLARLPIFSFLHPNKKGVDSFVARIMERYDQTQGTLSLGTTILKQGGSLNAYRSRFQVRRQTLRGIIADAYVDTIVIKIKAYRSFFGGMDFAYTNSVRIHLRQPIRGYNSLLVPSLKADSFTAFLDATTGLPREFDVDNNQLYGCFPIIPSQLGNMIGFNQLMVSDIAAIELLGTPIPDDDPEGISHPRASIQNGPDANITGNQIQILIDNVLQAQSDTPFAWTVKNGKNPSVRINLG